LRSPPVGIDLGTTRSVVATLIGAKPVAIPNRDGQLTTPSVVAFRRSGRPLVGRAAQRLATTNPDTTVSAVKRLLGSEALVSVGDRVYRPQEIAGLILRQLKEDAERWLEQPVTDAVITVPAYFNDRQRRAVREAAVLAGLTVPKLLNEPTAAALAYGIDREEARSVLVWDLGGGTFDVSVLELGDGIFEVLSVSGDGALGGLDFDDAIATHLEGQFRAASGAEYPADPRSRARLRDAAERVKVGLSTAPVVTAFLPFVRRRPTRQDLDIVISLETLERVVADLVQRLVPPTRQALVDAHLDPSQVDLVILAGNGTKMPVVRRLAAELTGSEPYRYLDADLVTAFGAAIQAGVIQGTMQRAILLDVLPLSLGVETKGGLFARIIARNTTLPASASQVFSTASDGQAQMQIEILQGERDLTSENVRLGHVKLDDLVPAPRGTVKVEVAFEVDTDGIVNVRATDLLAGRDALARFISSKQLDPEEIARLVAEADALADDDRDERQVIQAGIEADSAIDAGEKALESLAAGPGTERAAALDDAMWRIREILADGSVEELRTRCEALRRLLAAVDAEVAPA